MPPFGAPIRLNNRPEVPRSFTGWLDSPRVANRPYRRNARGQGRKVPSLASGSRPAQRVDEMLNDPRRQGRQELSNYVQILTHEPLANFGLLGVFQGAFGGNGREAAIRRNRTCQMCSEPHREGPHRLFILGGDVAVVRRKLPRLSERSRRFPRTDRTGSFPSCRARKRQPERPVLPETARSGMQSGNLRSRILNLCCALSQLPSRYPILRVIAGSSRCSGTGGISPGLSASGSARAGRGPARRHLCLRGLPSLELDVRQSKQ